MSHSLLVIWTAMAAVLACVVAVVAASLARAEAQSWPASLMCCGGAFAATLTLGILVIALLK